MNNEQKFQLCLEHAKQIVASYRAGAPEGCDPQASWIAVGVGVAGVGAGVASAATAKGDRFYSPAEASRKNIGAHLLYGAPAYAVNQFYNPAYAGLSNAVTGDVLFGREAQTIHGVTPVWQDGRLVRVGKGKGKLEVPGQEGLLSIYKRAGADLADFNRQQILDDLNIYAPAATQAYNASNPLMASLTQRAQQGLDQGGALDPSTRRELVQSSLGNASLRGFGHSPLDAYMAYSSLGAEAEARKRQREGFATQIAGMQPDPFALIGRPSLAATYGPAIGMQGAAWGRTASSPVINPFASMGVSSIPQDNTTSNILGAVSGGLLNMAGGFGGMGGMGGGQRPQGQTSPWSMGAGGYNQPRY